VAEGGKLENHNSWAPTRWTRYASALIVGARYSFFVGSLSSRIAASAGSIIGLNRGLAPKWVD